MIRKWGVLVLMLFVTPALAFAQSTGKLTGRVTDAATGEPLPGANVLLEGTTLGTATDVDGNYLIIGVPVGTYDVRATFVGFQDRVVEGVEINSGFTREIDFELAEGVELQEIVVSYERPLIQKDAIGAPRVVTSETIENLPVRGVANIAALQGGVIANEGSGDLFIRGGREEEVTYYIDGVKIIGLVGVPTHAIQEQEMLIGTIPARYGDVQSGVISITTKTGIGSEFFGTVEAITSEVLDDWGGNSGSLSLGGPLVRNRLSFFAAVEGVTVEDETPFAIDTYRLDEDALDGIRNSPQVIQIFDAGGTSLGYVPIPGSALTGETTLDDLEAMLTEQGLLPDGAHVSTNGVLVSAAELLTEDDFIRDNQKRDPQSDLRTNLNLTFQPTQQTNLRLTGGLNFQDDDTYNYARSFYAPEVYNEFERQTWRGAATWRQYLSNTTFYEISADYSDDRSWTYPHGFSKEIEDALFYGDVDGVDASGNPTAAFDVNSVARNYWEYDATAGTFTQRYQDGSLPAGRGVHGIFALPGTQLTQYIKTHNQQFRLSANATTQVNVHQIEFGGEFEQRTQRLFNIAAGQLATYFNDGDVEAGAANAVDSWDQLPFDVINSLIVGGQWYGYNYLGTEEVDDGDIDTFGEALTATNPDPGAFNIAPYKPIYYAGYVRDKIEFRDVILDLGLRVDVFDNNTQVLFDPFAFRPIVRVRDLSGVSVPGNIASDYAVYFAEGRATNAIVGYRDLDGNFFDTSGEPISQSDITTLGNVAQREGASLAEAYEDYEPQVTFMPRIGVSFPVTDQALFFASYNVLAQRPTEFSFLAPQLALDLQSGSAFANSNLEPEVTTQYELGFRQRLGARAALQLSGFYRTQTNKIGRRTLNASFPNPGYYGHFNVDFTTTKGAQFEFDLRRTRNISLNANYTLSFAQGTGSDAQTAATIAWRGNYFPDFITPAAFDRRHSINVTVDYRLGEGEGPQVGGAHLLENFGLSVVAVAQSGMPYTELETPVTAPITNQTNNFIRGEINGARFPWTNRIDLRLDRRFQLGNRANFTAFLWVENLLDRENVLGAYRGTGLPDDDGFLVGGSAETSVNAAASPDSYIFHYDALTDDPAGAPFGSFSGVSAYGLPRRTRLGVRLSF